MQHHGVVTGSQNPDFNRHTCSSTEILIVIVTNNPFWFAKGGGGLYKHPAYGCATICDQGCLS